MAKISVIVPVYNTEKYLRECLESLVAQTFNDVEIILIDDASTDGSRLIMEEYQKKYPNMIKNIYHDENKLPGETRNEGIKCAQSKYLMFVDSDDIIDSAMCEKLYNTSSNNDADIVLCSQKWFSDDEMKRTKDRLIAHKYLTGNVSDNARKYFMFSTLGPTNMIIKKQIIEDNKLFFIEESLFEDVPVIPMWLMFAKSIEVIEEPLYFYRQRTGSITKAIDNSGIDDCLKVSLMLYNRMIEAGFYEKYYREINTLFIITFYWNGLIRAITRYSKAPIRHMEYLGAIINSILPEYISKSDIERHLLPFIMDIMRMNDVSPKKLIETIQIKDEKIVVDYKEQYKQYYLKFSNDLKNLINYCEKCKYQIVIAGICESAQAFAEYLQGNAVSFSLFADKRYESQDNNFIIITNKDLYFQINTDIKQTNREMVIFDLESYLRYNLDIEECIGKRR